LRRAIAAMRGHPEMVAGTDRLCTALAATGRLGLVAKIGAEGLYGLAWERQGTGYGLALKIADGEGERSRRCAALEALRQLDVLPADEAAALKARFVEEVRTHRGRVVGDVRAVFRLAGMV